jgi:hypothetical protein
MGGPGPVPAAAIVDELREGRDRLCVAFRSDDYEQHAEGDAG